MKISELPIKKIQTALPTDTLSQCISLMNKQGIGALLIMEDVKSKKLLGIITERDVLRLLPDQPELKLASPVSKFMSTQVKTIDFEDDLGEAERLMAEGKFRHLPVLRAGELFSIISSKDIFEAMHTKNRINEFQLGVVQMIVTTVCHEMNNPLAIVQGHINKIKKLAKNETSSNLSEIERFEAIEKSTERMVVVVKKLSHFEDMIVVDYAGDSKLLDLNAMQVKLKKQFEEI